MHWAAPLIGLPWTPVRDCWFMVRYIIRLRLGIAMDAVADAASIRRASRLSRMRPVRKDERPQELDIAIMRSAFFLHAGVVVVANGRTGVLHSTRETGVIWQDWREATEGMTVKLWRRHD